METQVLGSVIYVAVIRVDGILSHVEQMFRGFKKTSFYYGGMTFSWVGDTLTVVGAPGMYWSITRLHEKVETHGSHGTAFCVAVFPTETKAHAFLAELANQPAIAA